MPVWEMFGAAQTPPMPTQNMATTSLGTVAQILQIAWERTE